MAGGLNGPVLGYWVKPGEAPDMVEERQLLPLYPIEPREMIRRRCEFEPPSLGVSVLSVLRSCMNPDPVLLVTVRSRILDLQEIFLSASFISTFASVAMSELCLTLNPHLCF